MVERTDEPNEAEHSEKTEAGTAAADRPETRMVAAMRLVLATLGLLFVYIDPARPDRFVEVTYATLALYTIYSAIIYAAVLRSLPFGESLRPWFHWIDVGWYAVLVALSGGVDSIFFMFFFFAIVAGAFQRGFKTGLGLALASSALFTVVGVLASRPEPAVELNRFMLRPLSLLAIGYMVSRWGGYRIGLQRRLQLLKELSFVSNPRFGVDRTIGVNIEKIRAFYGAHSCLYILAGSGSRPGVFYRAREVDAEAGCRAGEIPIEASSLFPVSDQGVVCGRTDGLPVDSTSDSPALEGRESTVSAARLAELLGARFFVSVPVRFRLQSNGRLYLARDKRAFHESDVTFLLQIVDQMAPILENIQLVERLASTAAEEERRKIARDIHDSIIQPYIGLQMGLMSVEQKMVQALRADYSKDKLAAVMQGVRTRVARLVALTEDGVAHLRGFVGQLKHGGESQGTLVPAIRRFALRFTEATGIETRVEAEDLPELNDRLAAEVFQMAAEGLSNIRRHTQSSTALIRLYRSRDSLLLRIENRGPGRVAGSAFTPRSITERAEFLQGRAFVEQTENKGSAVVVEIPL